MKKPFTLRRTTTYHASWHNSLPSMALARYHLKKHNNVHYGDDDSSIARHLDNAIRILCIAFYWYNSRRNRPLPPAPLPSAHRSNAQPKGIAFHRRFLMNALVNAKVEIIPYRSIFQTSKSVQKYWRHLDNNFKLQILKFSPPVCRFLNSPSGRHFDKMKNHDTNYDRNCTCKN